MSLPCGPVFLRLHVDPAVSTLRIAVADRKDFYHQLWAGPRKAVRNAMFPLSLGRVLLAPEPMDFCAKGVVQQSLLRCWCLRPAGPRSLPVSRLFSRGTTCYVRPPQLVDFRRACLLLPRSCSRLALFPTARLCRAVLWRPTTSTTCLAPLKKKRQGR